MANGNTIYLHDDFLRTDETLYNTLRFYAKATLLGETYEVALADAGGNQLGAPQTFSPGLSYSQFAFTTASFGADMSQVSTIRIRYAGLLVPTLLIDELTFDNVPL